MGMWIAQAVLALVAGQNPPPCTMTVVPCNYAHLYHGTFNWQITLQAPGSSTVMKVTASVKDGKASCVGTEDITQAGADPSHYTIDGPGLIGVEIVDDPHYPLAYKISVACPNPVQPGDPRPGPASLGNSASIETPNRPMKKIGDNLKDTVDYPAPETDPVNNVTGTVQIAWDLVR